MSDLIENTKQPLNSALYARVSTGRQENEQTIESQIAEVKKRIKDDGNTLLPNNIFIDDGWSGEILARPALDSMRDTAKENGFEALYIYDRGRLSRTFYHQEVVIAELVDRDIKFISIHDVEATTPEEKVLQSMQGVFHEYERVKIVERMRRGKLYKAKQGVIINGTPLYGYKFIKDNTTGIVRCEIDEDEAKAVRLVWKWFGIERLSINEIQKKLYDFGIKPRKRKSDFWTKGPISRLLKCDTYSSGKAYYNKSEVVVAKNPIKDVKYKKIKKTSRKRRPREDWIAYDVPKIVEDHLLFEKIQKMLDHNQRYSTKNRKHDYLLRGLIYCGCGSRRSGDGRNKHGHFYYRCNTKINNFPYPSKCSSGGINAGILDFTVWRELQKRLTSYPLLLKYAEKWLKTHSTLSNEDTLEKQRLLEILTKLNEEEGRYSKAYGANTLEFQQFQELMKDAKKRKISYNKQLDDLSSKTAKTNFPIKPEELVEESQKIIEDFDFANKFRVVQDIIHKVIVSERSGAEVWAKLPLPATITEKLGYESQRRTSRTSKCW